MTTDKNEMQYHDDDDCDTWAAQFTRWTEYAKANGLMKDRRTDYLPTCRKCKGYGKVFRNPQDMSSLKIECPRCKGRGTLVPKPSYSNQEIREVVNQLGEEKMRQLVRDYGKKKK